MKILITGADGLIGSRICEILGTDHELITPNYLTMNIMEKSSVDSYCQNLIIDTIIHLAAYTNVDKAEEEKDLCEKLNVQGTAHILDLARRKNARLIHISTDFVFAGNKPPYNENSIPDATNGWYGLTKLAAEKLVADEATIVRLCFPYRKEFPIKQDFVRSLANLLRQGKTLSMVSDCTITPTFIDDIAYSLQKLLKLPEKKLVHLVGSKSYSPYEAALLIANKIGVRSDLVQKTSFEEFYTGKAPRPQFSEIISINNDFHQMRDLQSGLDEIF